MQVLSDKPAFTRSSYHILPLPALMRQVSLSSPFLTASQISVPSIRSFISGPQKLFSILANLIFDTGIMLWTKMV